MRSLFFIYKPREVLAPSLVCCSGSLNSLHQFTFNFILVTLARDTIAAAVSNRIADCLKKNLKASRLSNSRLCELRIDYLIEDG